MPKGKLEFNLPEDEDAFKLAQRGPDYYVTILSIQNIIREVNKYGKNLEEAFKEIEEMAYDAETEDIQ